MRGRKSSLKIDLSACERQELEHWTRSTSAPAGRARRARIVMLVASGLSLVETGRVVGVMETVVRKWCRRFLASRIDGLGDLPRPGRPPARSQESLNGPSEHGQRVAAHDARLAAAADWS